MTFAAIDLGGTNMRVAYRDGDRLCLAGTEAGIPAAVWLSGPGEARVGELAADGPAGEVLTAVRADLRAGPRAAARERYIHGRFEPPEAVAGYLLADAARRASAASTTTVGEVMLGAPVGAVEEPSLRRAAAAAGLVVAGVIAEPVAVALHYGVVGDDADRTVVVHDLGGTTLDVCVLKVSGRNVAILNSATYLIGGAEFDDALARDLLAEADVPGTEPRADILEAVAWLRQLLSDIDEASVRLPGVDREFLVSRSRLATATEPLVSRIAELTEQTVGEAAAVSREWPTSVLLAGGASRMPMVTDALARRLGVDVRSADPELAVVRGLAVAHDFGLLFVTGHDGTRPSLPPSAGPAAAGRAPAPAAEPVPVPTPPADIPVVSPPAPVPPVPPVPAPAVAPADESEAETLPLRHRSPRETAPLRQDLEAESPKAAKPPEPLRVRRLSSLRRGEHVLLTWEWPQDSALAEVRWELVSGAPGKRGSVRYLRRMYDHQGGFELPVGSDGAEVTVIPLAPDGSSDGASPSVVQVPPADSAITYDPELRREWRPWSEWLKHGLFRWIATMTFTSDTVPALPDVLVLLGTGSYRPESTRDGEVVFVVSPAPLQAGRPVVVSFPFARPRGTCWLVCFPKPGAGDAPPLLRPAALHRLRVH